MNDFKNSDKSLKYKFKLINIILTIATLASFLVAFVLVFLSNQEIPILVLIFQLSYGFLNLFLFLLLKYNKDKLNLIIYISITSLYLLQVIVMINMIDDSFREAWFFLTVIASFFLGGKKFGYIMLSLISITILIYNFQPFIDTKFNTLESILPLILLLIIGFIMNLYETTKENYAKSLKEANNLLESKIEELKHFNLNLEHKVQEEIKINGQHELKLFEQAKMVAMGEMIGNIAHQWRQPLSVISTIATGSKLQKDMDILTNEMFANNMNIINENTQYLSRTIDDFRNFVKEDRVKKLFNLSEEIHSFLHLVQGSIKSTDIDIILDLDDDIQVNGYPNELKQCLINIFNNAKDAIEESKEEHKVIFIKTYNDKEKTIIIIKDNATGIPKDILPKIFDPYFTTKHQSKGTGLGLNMTYKLIVEGMKGTIEATNVSYEYKDKKYKGAEFKICLPFSL